MAETTQNTSNEKSSSSAKNCGQSDDSQFVLETVICLEKVQEHLKKKIAALENNLIEAQEQLKVKQAQFQEVTAQKDEAEKRIQTVEEESESQSSRQASSGPTGRAQDDRSRERDT